MTLRIKSLYILGIVILTSCSVDNASLVQSEFNFVPSNCLNTKAHEHVIKMFPDIKYLDVELEPKEGTDLFAAYNSGGIACSYGLQEDDVSATILWAPDNKFLFSQLTPDWIISGQKEIDLREINEEKAYFSFGGGQGQGEHGVSSVNLLIYGFWIQVSGKFFSSLEDLIPFIKVAIESLFTSKQATDGRITGCYLAELPEDLYVFNVHYHDNNTIAADFYYKNINGEPSKGLFLGTYTNGIARGFYSLPTSNGTSERELFLKGDKNGFVTASAKLEKVGSIEKYVRPLDIKWSQEIKFIPAQECEGLLRG